MPRRLDEIRWMARQTTSSMASLDEPFDRINRRPVVMPTNSQYHVTWVEAAHRWWVATRLRPLTKSAWIEFDVLQSNRSYCIWLVAFSYGCMADFQWVSISFCAARPADLLSPPWTLSDSRFKAVFANSMATRLRFELIELVKIDPTCWFAISLNCEHGKLSDKSFITFA